MLKKFFFILGGLLMLSSCDQSPPNVTLSVMTFNIENGGTQVDFNKVVEAIKKAGADVVGIQEPWGNTATLANALGWKYFNAQQHIISRYPLLLPEKDEQLYTFIELLPGKVVAMSNMHLPDEPYGPGLVLKGKPRDEVIEIGKKVRLPTALPYIKTLAALAKQGIPVFITGDFNSPSDLDWTDATVNQYPDHHYAISWPITKAIEENGLTDSYRKMYVDPVQYPAKTWPSGRPKLEHAIDGFNPSASDLPERIDFVFSGNAKVLESHVVAEPEYLLADITVSPWPSDHRAIVSRFEVAPVLPPFNAQLITVNALDHRPSITVSSSFVESGEPIRISWQEAPGNRFDYIRINPAGSNKLEWNDAVRLYTNASSQGSIEYDKKNAAGNRPEWCRFFNAEWPLKPGVYEVKLMLDDSNTELASTQFTVHNARS